MLCLNTCKDSLRRNLLYSKPRHPSLGFQKKSGVYTVDIGRSYRAIARRLGVSTKTVERDMSGVHELCLDRFDLRRAACA